MPSLCNHEEKDLLRRELSWLGYGALMPGLLAYPSADRQSLDETLMELGLTGKTLVYIAGTEDLASREVLRRLSHDCWNLDEIEKRYNHFCPAFSPCLPRLEKSEENGARSIVPGANPAGTRIPPHTFTGFGPAGGTPAAELVRLGSV